MSYLTRIRHWMAARPIKRGRTISALMALILFGSMARAEETTDLNQRALVSVSSWANTVFGPSKGQQLDAGQWWPAAAPPFSFVYDGKSSESLLPSWKRTAEKHQQPDGTHYVTTWLDAETGLKVVATAKVFKDFPAVDWVLRFENTGKHDTPILEKVQALDIALKTEPKAGRGPRSNPRRRLQPPVVPADRAPLEAGRVGFHGAGRRPVVGHRLSLLQSPVRQGRVLHRHRLDGPMGGRDQPREGRDRPPAGRHGVDPSAAAARRGHPHAPHHAPALDGRSHRSPQLASAACSWRITCRSSTASRFRWRSPRRRSTAPADADTGPASPGRLSRRASIATWAATPFGSTPAGSRATFPKAWAIGFPSPRSFPAACVRWATPARGWA